MLGSDEFESLRQRLEQKFNETVAPRRIRALRVNSGYRWQPPLHIEVGKYCRHLTPDGGPEKVVAIFESRSFLVCTEAHGYPEGRPHIFTRADVREVVDES